MTGEAAPFDVPLFDGTRIGRYTVLKRIGAGGVGVVYAALDGELDREVAIKILRTDRAGGSSRAHQEDQLIKEARAMAQLAHPNVVAVFEIGHFRDQLFLAMELVDGQTLAHWLSRQRRSWREIVEVFVAAGRGLAAAHAAGLVHRDFKPANVLVGHDGRVRVTDFGLVQDATSTDASPAVAGTPLYMAPEQFCGDPAGPRSDQFNFCVALYRALYGRPPFPGDSVAELADAVIAGRLRPPPARAGVPRWLGRVVMRGLATAPEARHGSMAEVLRKLQHAPHRWLRRSAAVAAIAGAAMAVPLVWQGQSDPRPSCSEVAQRMTAVWGPEQRQRVEQMFRATGTQAAADAFANVARTIDGYAKRWTDMRTDLCESVRAAPGPADELAGLRGTCLDRRLSELRALLGAFADESPQLVERGPKAAHDLTDLAGCADARALMGPTRLPSAPGERARIEALRDQLAGAQALRRLGRYREAVARAKSLVSEVSATGYRPLEAETWLLVVDAAFEGTIFDEWVPAIEKELIAAEKGGADELVIRGLLHDMYWKGIGLGKYDEILQSHPLMVNAKLERLGGNDELAGGLHAVLARLWRGANRYDKEAEHSKRALELLEHRFGPNDPRLSPALFVAIWSAWVRFDWDTVRELSERMYKIMLRAYGPDHPETAQAEGFVAMAHVHSEQLAAAGPLLAHALAVIERTVGPDETAVADILVKYAEYSQSMGRFAEALGHVRRAADIVDQKTHRNGRFHGEIHSIVALTLAAQHRDLETLAEVRDAEPAVHETSGDGSLSMSLLHMAKGEALLHLKRYDEAREQLQASLAILDKLFLFEPDHPRRARRYRDLGQIALGAGDPQQALVELDRARALSDTKDGSLAIMRAELDFGTACALGALHRDPSRARALAESARAVFASSPDLESSLREVDAWLVRQPR